MYKEILTQLGLTQNEAIIYEYLLKNGESSAGIIIKKTPLKRGVVYNTLADLVKKGLAAQKSKEKIAYFSPNHPDKLHDYLKNREEELKKAKNTLEANLPSIISNFNLVSNQPGIQYYEGLKGIQKVLDDSLLNNPEKLILTFSDGGNYGKYLKEWNAKHYAPKRRELKIIEKVIMPATEETIAFMTDYMKNPKARELTKLLLMEKSLLPPFATEINIYSDRASFVTFSDKGHIGVIIQNQEIVNTLTAIFNLSWLLGKQYCLENHPEWISE